MISAALALPLPPMTGWPPGLLQDDDRKLSYWLANRLGARRLIVPAPPPSPEHVAAMVVARRRYVETFISKGLS